MPRLPAVSGRKAVKVFQSLGWEVARQRGSHTILTKEGHRASLSVPNHKEVAKGTLAALLRAADLTADEFIAAGDGR